MVPHWSTGRITPNFSGRALPCDARRERIMKWRTRAAAATPYHVRRGDTLANLAKSDATIPYKSSTMSNCVPEEIATERCLLAAPEGMNSPSPALNEITCPLKLILKEPFST